ncbi:MAG: SprT family zinc-dependent metalloprotease [Campylobacterota bacterium]|nr:SprT family zinc-dependent metalloprotease [Campylobacterota bacterium]
MAILPNYTHIINPKLKHIYLTFDPEGDLIIKSPRISQREIEKVLIKKAAWITKSRQKIQDKKGKPLRFKEGEEVFFLGKPYPLQFEKSEKMRSSLRFDQTDGFILHYKNFEPERFQKLIEYFYKQEAQLRLPEITQYYAARMQLFPSKISFRRASKRWGSCSSSNAISFNYLMMKLPLPVIQYIIVHELAHIKYKHHQRDFWELVGIYLPDFKEREKELKLYM